MLKFYQCEKCKKIVISREELKLEGFVELIADSTDAAQEKHVPVVSKKCKQIQVDVGSVAHPMTEEHLIEWVAVETQKGYQIAELAPGMDPIADFAVAEGDVPVAAYEYCNLHGLWKAEI
jgi:superoxide reductase